MIKDERPLTPPPSYMSQQKVILEAAGTKGESLPSDRNLSCLAEFEDMLGKRVYCTDYVDWPFLNREDYSACVGL
jgi:hypothetical protein